jgi:gas vesicle protein
MFAPSSGRSLRQDVGGKLDKIRERVKSEIDSKPSTATANSHHA